MNNQSIVAIILARGGSKGIKNKNLKLINKKPLIYWSIKACLDSKKIGSVWVSSDSDRILNLSKKFGANIIKRPKQISNDSSISEEAWIHSIKEIKKKKKIDIAVGVQPTSPLRNKNVFDKAINFFIKKKLDSLFTAQIVSDHFLWIKEKNKLLANYNYKKRPMRQNIKKKYLENGSFYIFNSEKFLKKKCRLFGKIGCYVMKKIYSFQIDEIEDINLINSLKKYF